jgi:hypothetical protein
VTLGIVASLNEGKGHDDALAAAAELRASGLDVPLVFIGAGETVDRERLEGRAEQLGLADLVTLTGALADRTALYSLIDIVAVTSRAEAFGRIPFEATAAGLPVIYADAGGVGEYMESGVSGIGYRPGDTHALADAIRALVQDAPRRMALVAAASETLGAPRRHDDFASSIWGALRGAVEDYSPSSTQVMTGWMAKGTLDSVRASEALAQDNNALRQDLDSRRLAWEVLHQELVTVHADHARVNLAYAELWREREELQKDHARVNLAYADLWRGREVLQKDYSMLQERNEAVRGERDRIVASRTWRYSQPLRRLGAALRGRRP